MTLHEVAEYLGAPYQSVWASEKRALEKLRSGLEELAGSDAE